MLCFQRMWTNRINFTRHRTLLSPVFFFFFFLSWQQQAGFVLKKELMNNSDRFSLLYFWALCLAACSEIMESETVTAIQTTRSHDSIILRKLVQVFTSAHFGGKCILAPREHGFAFFSFCISFIHHQDFHSVIVEVTDLLYMIVGYSFHYKLGCETRRKNWPRLFLFASLQWTCVLCKSFYLYIFFNIFFLYICVYVLSVTNPCESRACVAWWSEW